MPTITQIVEQKRRQNRRSVHLDGKFAFGCNINVVAKFRLREGLSLSAQQLQEIEQGELRQDCFDAAMRLLQSRLHSRAELTRKLKRRECPEQVIAIVLDDLTRMEYVDDARFARTKALSAAEHRKHGKRRAMMELLRSGVNRAVAQRAVDDIYAKSGSFEIARKLVEKQMPRLSKLEPLVARRRLVGMLQRRGFDYDEIKPVIDAAFASSQLRGEPSF